MQKSHVDLLRVLVNHRVDFIIVGGLAAVLQGAPVVTLDIDIVYARTPENIARMQRALDELDAEFRDDPRRLRPNLSHLESTGHKLLKTRFGSLDVLGTIEESTSYEDLVPSADELVIADLTVHVLSLERLIEVKRTLTRLKDRMMLEMLEATLDERRKA